MVHAVIPDNGYRKSVEAFSAVMGADEELLNYNKSLIRGLDYTHKRALRAFAMLETVCPEELVAVLQKLYGTAIRFDDLLLLEQFVLLEGANIDLAWQFLEKLGKLDFTKGRVMTPFTDIYVLSAPELLAYVDRVQALKGPAAWAFKAFLALPEQSASAIDRAMISLNGMNDKQQWAAEECCKIKGMTSSKGLELLNLISTLSKTDAWNARGLFKQDVTPEQANSWLRYYFSEDQEQKEWLFFGRSPEEKAVLLKGLAEASDYITWKINDLHSVTNERGQEISSATLNGASREFLEQLWKRLDSKVRENYASSFYKALDQGKKSAAIQVLRSATGKARVQAGLDITTMHIYILLSKGSELYDSSFRDILVPILSDRIEKRFQGNLLRFLLEVDPENNHVSDFIISLAQRGKLAVFFPEDAVEQERVLDLVTQSAFQDEHSLILFSATFMKLLETIEPKTRSYLIEKMLSAIREQNSVFSTQLRVILQYYLEYYTEFVGEVDKIRIRMMMYEYGAIPLDYYTRTAFKEWKSDGHLSSLSVFHDDDDGKQSYLSNCQYLSSKGYRPRVSTLYSLGASAMATSQAAQLVHSYAQVPSQSLRSMFHLQVQNPLIMDWVKTINGIEISHSVFVFQGELIQQELLKQFLQGDFEMFAQRGHSYWRSEQLITPITELVKKGTVTEEDLGRKQRFMSLGSCGGIRAYSKLARLFHNRVDILATVGTGKAVVNNPYNQFLFEAVANSDSLLSWDDVADQSSKIFSRGLGEDYLQPGSLPAILHKIMDEKTQENGTDQKK
jgi:hypothetical protein